MHLLIRQILGSWDPGILESWILDPKTLEPHLTLFEKSAKDAHRKIIEMYVAICSPNSFPAIGVLAGLIERLVIGTHCRALPGGRVRARFVAIYLTW